MAVATLSPWPNTTATVALAAARTCLGDALGLTDESTLDRLGSTAAALVEREAPLAPLAIKNEATIRCAAWMYEAPASGARREDIGDVSTAWSPNATGGLRASGAMSMLSRWKQRRGGAIG